VKGKAKGEIKTDQKGGERGALERASHGNTSQGATSEGVAKKAKRERSRVAGKRHKEEKFVISKCGTQDGETLTRTS